MFTENPFAALASSVSPGVMQTFVVVMLAFVVLGTLFDMLHKQSATYFFDNWRKANAKARRQVGGGEVASLAIKTALVDWLTSGEFCSARRRMAHLLTMYGFLAYVITTIVMVFAYPTPDVETPTILPALWHLGALMICLGGYWFWFFIRVDVSAEGNSPFRIVRADLFVLSLLTNATLALIWSWLQSSANAWANVALALYLIATIVLFGSVPWSKLSHMFYKPAAAFQKRLEDANGFRSNLPNPADKPETFGSARQKPRHY
jgi:predicted small integral membrane protein